MSQTTTAVDMARTKGLDPKAFRSALRATKLLWHVHNERWTVEIGSEEHEDMKAVLSQLPKEKPSSR